MEKKTLVIDIEALELAAGNNSPGHRSYLDIETGQVLTFEGPELHDPVNQARLSAEPGRLILVEPVPPRVQHAWMLNFIDTVRNPKLSAELMSATNGRGAFRQFKQLLRSYPIERERWYRCRSGLLREYIHSWLLPYGVLPVDSSLAAALYAVEAEDPASHDQNLRRLAEAYVDHLPVPSLQLAIIYLQYLQANTHVMPSAVAGRLSPAQREGETGPDSSS